MLQHCNHYERDTIMKTVELKLTEAELLHLECLVNEARAQAELPNHPDFRRMTEKVHTSLNTVLKGLGYKLTA